jgi:hypothetical protein
MRTENEQHVYCAFANGVIKHDEQEKWVTYLTGLEPAAAATVRMTLLGEASERSIAAAAASRPASSKGKRPAAAGAAPVQQVQQVAPRSGAEAAAMLGPRPGGSWFPGCPSKQEADAQAAWDAQVRSATTMEEFEAREVAFLMQSPRGLTEA